MCEGILGFYLPTLVLYIPDTLSCSLSFHWLAFGSLLRHTTHLDLDLNVAFTFFAVLAFSVFFAFVTAAT
jgi:hypothetical protein